MAACFYSWLIDFSTLAGTRGRNLPHFAFTENRMCGHVRPEDCQMHWNLGCLAENKYAIHTASVDYAAEEKHFKLAHKAIVLSYNDWH